MLKIREDKSVMFSFFKKKFVVFVWFACLYVCTTFVPVALRGQKKASSAGTEVVDGDSTIWILETELCMFCSSSKCF